MSELANRPHVLYRFLDASDALLYIGITADVGARWASHAVIKTWWTHVATIRIEHHATRSSVLDAERAAIIAEGPRYNVKHARPGAGEDVAVPTWVGPRPPEVDRYPATRVRRLWPDWTGELDALIASMTRPELEEVVEACRWLERRAISTGALSEEWLAQDLYGDGATLAELALGRLA